MIYDFYVNTKSLKRNQSFTMDTDIMYLAFNNNSLSSSLRV